MPEDWFEISVSFHATGKYDLDVWQGCGTGNGGSLVEFELANQKRTLEIKDTGHFQNFEERRVGSFQIERAGRYDLKVRAIRKAKQAVCDIRQLRLTPAEEK